MDPTDKKRAQPTTSDSTPSPPSKRRQMSSAAPSAADEQSAAASGHPTAMAAAAAAPFPVAASAASASTRPAGLADSASSAASLLSPAQRCPSDPLSVILSFLDTRDFAVASRVCRHWCRASDLQSAWPEFSIERLIRGLIEDEYHWICLRSPSRTVRVNGALPRLAQSSTWRRLGELCFRIPAAWERVEVAPLDQVAQLPHLQALHFDRVGSDDVAAAFTSMAPRLLAFDKAPHCARNVVQLYLHLLVNLRVLVLDDVEGQSLLSLHQLEYLQLRNVAPSNSDVLLVIRRMSVQHRLRHVSLTAIKLRTIYLPALAERSGPDQLDIDIAPAALVSIRLRCTLSQACPSALLSLPSLTRLEWSGDTFANEPAVRQQQWSAPSPLQQLYLDFNRDGGSVAHLLQQAAARAPQLRELHITNPPPAFDQLIRPLRSLRLLDITLSPVPLELLQALASLPLFSELLVRQIGRLPITSQLGSDSLRCIAASCSWRLVRFIGCPDRPQVELADDVDASLAKQLADLRVQIVEPAAGLASVYRLVAEA